MNSSNNSVRHISVRTASAFVISSMIGTGVFTSLGFQLVNIQTIFPILMLWVVGGFLALFGAFAYSELAASLPRSGGEYHLLSRVIHPSVGFMGGFVSATVGFSAPAVLAAMALGKYVSVVFPSINSVYVATVTILFFNIIHGFSLRYGTLIQDIATLIKIGLIVVFIFLGFTISNPQQITLYPVSGDILLLMSPSFAVSLVWVSYAYTGWNSTVYIAGEVENPQKNIHKSLLLSTSFVMILYILLNFIFLYTTPISEMIGKVEVGYISGVNIFGNIGAKIVSASIAILLISTVSSYVYIGPRITQVMGEDHLFLNFLSKKNSKKIPFNGFVLQLIISLLFILSSSFEQILLYAGITFIMTTTATVFGVFVLRAREPALLRPYKAWGHPWTSGIFILSNLWILFYTFMEQPFESLIGLGILSTSLVIYFLGTKFFKKD